MNDELEMQKDALGECKEQLFDAENLLDGAIEKPKEKEHQQNWIVYKNNIFFDKPW